jgi:protein-tyrosine phosphatase
LIDLHTHILPGVDDGVKEEDEAIEFARAAFADGVRTLVATPHSKDGFFENGREEVLAAVERLEGKLREAGIGITLLPGAEVYIAPDLVERVKDGRALTLGDNGKTLLLELSLSQYPMDLQNLVFSLRLAGLIVLFAHPERIRYFQEDVKRWEEMVRLGAYGQITTGSVLGTFGEDAQESAELLLRRGLAHVLASDAHNLRGRPPILSRAVEAVAAIVGEEEAGKMVSERPRALLDGRDPEPPPVMERQASKRSLLSRLFGRGEPV